MKQITIHQRRYIGSKTKLLNFIDDILKQENASYSSVADIFAGTGVVGHHFNNKAAITLNDMLESNYLAHQAFLGPQAIDKDRLDNRICHYNELNADNISDNYFSDNFADTYFSHENCRLIGFIRDDIEDFSKTACLNERERAYLITSLIYAMDRIANTVGHYDAYRRSGCLDKKLELGPLVVGNQNQNNKVLREDANRVVGAISSDVVYIDPPYNSRQYSDAYHLLENVASWQKPAVSGVAKKMDRAHLKSRYSLKSAGIAFSDLIENIHPSTKYIVVSYNDMGSSGDQRSQARISDHEIISALERRGALKVYEKEFRQFTTGKSSKDDLKERIFFCKPTPRRHNKPARLTLPLELERRVKSPLNYTGGKYKLLPQLLKFFPSNIGTFYDVFCGGASVGVNVNAKRIVCLDNSPQLIDLLKYIQTINFETLNQDILRVIDKYGLSQSYSFGYEYYGTESSQGLGKYNKPRYLRLRDDYNNANKKDRNLLLLCLIFYGFNNQLRFNSEGKFNLPVGKRDYNGSSRKNLAQFNEAINRKLIDFKLNDFRNLLNVQFSANDFVYLDPPYLLGLATYNENGGWSESDERDLHNALNELDAKDVRFALSNVIEHKGFTNKLLKEWAAENGFCINYLNYHYKNSNYQSRAKHSTTQEVLVTNYKL